LANDDALLAQVFEQRFDTDSDELTGHALGNLIIAGSWPVPEMSRRPRRAAACSGPAEGHSAATEPVS